MRSFYYYFSLLSLPFYWIGKYNFDVLKYGCKAAFNSFTRQQCRLGSRWKDTFYFDKRAQASISMSIHVKERQRRANNFRLQWISAMMTRAIAMKFPRDCQPFAFGITSPMFLVLMRIKINWRESHRESKKTRKTTSSGRERERKTFPITAAVLQVSHKMYHTCDMVIPRVCACAVQMC